MIHLHGNWLGIGMFVVGGLIAGFGAFILKLSDPITMIVVGVMLILLDLIARRILFTVDRSWTRSDRGGSIYRVPMWAIGLLVIAANVINGLTRAQGFS